MWRAYSARRTGTALNGTEKAENTRKCMIMTQAMADIARSALQQGRAVISDETAKRPATILCCSPVVADVWISGRLGFVLLLHRRHDGLVGEELYYSLRSEDGVWDRPDHLSGSIVGWDTPAVEDALAGASMSVVADSESLIYTGRAPNADDGERVKIYELLISSNAELIEIECFSPASPTPAFISREVTGPLMLLVLLPGERMRVHTARREKSSLRRLGGVLDLHNVEQ
ncbi:hypothetical protein [Streptomyces sp. NPDC046985]|uniref:hypothetical protein n=1 Tax=Streptomyces sp. NPDC046985 TaxID=3155377 RepID=UPI0033C451F9